MALTTTQINQLYVSYFGRPADFAGLQYYQNANATPNEVAAAFASSRESQALFGSLPTAAQINAVYQNLFNRDAEPDGLAYWTLQVSQGRLSVAAVALAVGNGAQGNDRTIIQNKVALANSFVAALDTYEEIQGYTGDDAAASARSFIKSIGATIATGNVQGQADAAVAAAVAVGGRTFALTTGPDTLTGTSGNDTFVATASLIQPGDSIDGGMGEDTFVYTGASTGYVLPALNSIERLQFDAPTTTAIDTVALNGLNTVVVNNPATGTAITSSRPVILGRTGSGPATVDALAVYDSNSGVSVGIKGGLTIGNLTAGSGILKAVLLASNGAANTVATLNASAQPESRLFLSGTSKLTIGEINDMGTLSTVNASATTGGVDLTLGNYMRHVVGGSGDDRFSLGTTIGPIDGGAGEDTVAIAWGDLASFSEANGNRVRILNAMTNIETLEFTSAASAALTDSTPSSAIYFTTSFFNTAVIKIVFNTTDTQGTDTVNAANTTRTYAFGGLNEGAATLNLDSGVTTINVSLEGAAAGAATGGTATVTTLTIAPRATDLAADPSLTTTVHIASSGVAGVGANAISTVTAQAGSTIKVTGSNDLAIAALTNRATVDASSFAGKLAIAGSAGADTIILGSGQDTVTVGAAGSTFAHIDTIAGFTSADTLILAGAPVAAAADLVKQDVSAAGSLEQALASVEAVTAANGVSYFNYAGNTYVLANTGAGSVTAPGSDDLVVRIVGVQVLTADASGIHGKIAA